MLDYMAIIEERQAEHAKVLAPAFEEIKSTKAVIQELAAAKESAIQANDHKGYTKASADLEFYKGRLEILEKDYADLDRDFVPFSAREYESACSDALREYSGKHREMIAAIRSKWQEIEDTYNAYRAEAARVNSVLRVLRNTVNSEMSANVNVGGEVATWISEAGRGKTYYQAFELYK